MISLFSPEEERKMIAVLIYIYKNGSGTCLGRDGAERMEEWQAHIYTVLRMYNR